MILVFGRHGQVATELRRHGNVEALGRKRADLADPESCVAAIHAFGPSAVINAAAYTAVDKAEDDEATANLVNGAAPAAMARACADLGVPFVHISTDYVFDGEGNVPFAPNHPTAPLGAYGRTKRTGEEGVISAGGIYAILRTSWVFSAHGNNFLKAMLRLGAERDALSVVGDQIGGPTPASAIAKACLSIAAQLQTDPSKSGIYHFSGVPDVSWADFAREIFTRAGLNCRVENIPSSAYPTPAKRPANSRMDCANLATFELARPDWAAEIDDIVKELM